MTLCLDVGNSQIFGGLFNGDKLLFRFRRITERIISSDELGLFFRNVIRENGHNPKDVESAAYCSVVPDINHSLRNSCIHYFDAEPFELKAGVKTGLKIRYKNPTEVGADRIADAISAVNRYPDTNLIIVDFGTASTVEAITAKKEYLGGAIAPGLRISMRALEEATASLPKVEILRPDKTCGRSTVESIQSGLYWGHLGMLREIIKRYRSECFPKGQNSIVIATGGFAGLFADSGLFDVIHPDLVLEGIRLAQILNHTTPKHYASLMSMRK